MIRASNNVFPHDPDDNWRIKLDRGGYDGTAQDLCNLINDITAPDGVLIRGEVIKTDNVLSIDALAFTCRIDHTELTNTDEFETTIATATDGYHRIDILVFTKFGTIVKIQGDEGIDSAEKPDVPNDTIEISFISVFGDEIGDPVVIDISGKEDISNKTNDIEGNKTSSTKYGSVKGFVDWVIGIPKTITAIWTFANDVIIQNKSLKTTLISQYNSFDGTIENYKNKHIGTIIDYNSSVILLFPVYNGVNIAHAECLGSMLFRRGRSGAGHHFAKININCSTAYNSNVYNISFDPADTTQYSLVTCTYGGIKYLAIKNNAVPNPASKDVGFDGYIQGDTNALLIVPYYNTDTSTILNAEINSSIVAVATNTVTEFGQGIATSKLIVTDKATSLVDADKILINDSEDGYKTKTRTFLQLITTLSTRLASYFQTIDNQVEIGTSGNVQNSWHGQTILFTANCTITVPSTLNNSLMFPFRTLAGVTVTWAITSPFTWETTPSTTPEKTVGHFMRRGATNTIILDM